MLACARLYLVCDEPAAEFLDAALRGGVDVVQLRMKHAGDERILAAAARVRAACRRHGVLAILNDRPDLAARAEMDGVHLGQDDVAVREARRIVGAQAIIGLSTHSARQIEAAHAAGVDYIGVGPVHATPTKPGRAAVGLGLVHYAAEHAALPWFAIGGIAPETIEPVVAAGAERVAVVRALSEAEDPEAAARSLRAVVERQKADVGAA